MTEKRFTLTFDDKIIDNLTGIIHDVHSGYDVAIDLTALLNDLNDENEQLKQVIAENEKILQSTYDELTKLRCIKKNLGRIKSQWDWIMEAIQYD
mgnify:CR=1 FL=1